MEAEQAEMETMLKVVRKSIEEIEDKYDKEKRRRER